MLDKFPAIQSALQEIASDNHSGAAEILSRAVILFSLIREAHTKDDAHYTIIELCAKLVNAQPDMAPLASLANAVTGAVINLTETDDAFCEAEEAAKLFIENAKRASYTASKIAAQLIHDGSIVLTHSRSSTVLEAFLIASRLGRKFHVLATESRPIMEGRTLAQSLALEKIDVTLIADSAVAALMDKVDFVLVGADKLTPDFVMNKIGTRLIALAARERDIPIYSICDSSKFISFAHSLRDEQRDPNEFWPDAPPGVVLLNRYFEHTPLDYFTRIISEEGKLTIEEAANQAKNKYLHRELVSALQIPEAPK
jgi:translation initiation factor 2B subunit (eIF-2B alpha/beta/delta family)